MGDGQRQLPDDVATHQYPSTPDISEKRDTCSCGVLTAPRTLSILWEGLSQTSCNQGRPRGRWHVNWLNEGQSRKLLMLSMSQFYAEPRGHSSSLEALCLGLHHITLRAGHLPPFARRSFALTSSVSQGMVPTNYGAQASLATLVSGEGPDRRLKSQRREAQVLIATPSLGICLR